MFAMLTTLPFVGEVSSTTLAATGTSDVHTRVRQHAGSIRITLGKAPREQKCMQQR